MLQILVILCFFLKLDSWQNKAAGFRVCRFSFCTDCGIIFTDNSPNELLVWSGLKISVSTSAQLTKFSLPHAYL
nr:MAG TPA: hypothetical protein [Caudoviricetes sp.]